MKKVSFGFSRREGSGIEEILVDPRTSDWNFCGSGGSEMVQFSSM